MKNKFFKKILFKAQYLELEEEEFCELLPQIRAEFFRDLSKYCESIGINLDKDDPQNTDIPQKTPLDRAVFNTPEVKLLFRKAALRTHPDKKHTDSYHPKGEELFKLIQQAEEEGDLIKLISIAAELDLIEEINGISPIIEKQFLQKEEKIQKLKKDVAYRYNQLSEEDKVNFLKNLIKK